MALSCDTIPPKTALPFDFNFTVTASPSELLGVDKFAFVLFFFSLEFLPLLNPIKEFLNADALSLQIGTAKFSAYLIIQGVIIIATLLWLTGFLSDIAAKFIKKIPGINSNNRNLITKALQILIY